MELRDLRYLAASALAGNFTAAAGSLGLNSSTISRRIARLEDELGVTLFERGHFGIRLTSAGRAIIVDVRRALDDIEAIERSGQLNGRGRIGRIRLGLRMPPVGEPLRSLLASWHAACASVTLHLYELDDYDLRAAFADRRLDAAFVTRHTLWPEALAIPLYRERILAAVPVGHHLCNKMPLRWADLRSETILTQEWDGSHSAREFFASLLGSGVSFCPQADSKQSVLALVGAGFGVTLATESQSAVVFPGVSFVPVDEANAWVQVDLAWAPRVEEPAVGRFLAFLRDEAWSRSLAQ